MKTFTLVVLSLWLALPGISRLSAQEEFSRGVGLAAKSSTNGFGGDAVLSFHKRMSLRLGYEKLALARNFDFEEGSVNYNASMDYQTGSLSMLLDYYLIPNVFVTAGAGWNMFEAVIDGVAIDDMAYGDIQIPSEDIGVFSAQVVPTYQLSPYAGLGFGRTLGLKKKVGFAIEVGGFYQGPPKLKFTSTGLLSPTSNPDQQHAARLEKQIEQYSIYPILKFSLSYKIAGF